MALLCRFAHSGGSSVNIKVDPASTPDVAALVGLLKREFMKKSMPLPGADAITIHDGKDDSGAVLDHSTPIGEVGLKRGKWFFLAYAEVAEAPAPAPAAAEPPSLATPVTAAPTVDIGIPPSHHSDPLLLPHGLLLESYSAALPPRVLAGSGISAFRGEETASSLQEEGSTAAMLVPELPISLHFLACPTAPAPAPGAPPPAVPMAQLPLSLGSMRRAVQALGKSTLLGLGVLPPLGMGVLPPDARHIHAWSAGGQTTVGVANANTEAVFRDAPEQLLTTLLQGCSKTLSLLPADAPAEGAAAPGAGGAGEDPLKFKLGAKLHSLGLTTYHPWVIRAVLSPPAEGVGPPVGGFTPHVVAVDLRLQLTDSQLDAASVGDLVAATIIAVLSRPHPLRLELREGRASMQLATAVLDPSGPLGHPLPGVGEQAGGGKEGGGEPTPPRGLVPPLGALPAYHGSPAASRRTLLGGDVPAGDGSEGSSVMGSGVWGGAGELTFNKVWGAGGGYGVNLPLPVPRGEDMGAVLEQAKAAGGQMVMPEDVPLGAYVQQLLAGGALGIYRRNETVTRGTSAATQGPGAALSVVSADAITRASLTFVPVLSPATRHSGPLAGTVWTALPWAVTAVLPLAPHTYTGRGLGAVRAGCGPTLSAVAEGLPAGYTPPAPLPPLAPRMGPPPTNMNEVVADLEHRNAMFVILHGKNFVAGDGGDGGRPGVGLEMHEDATVGHLLQALAAGEAAGPGLADFGGCTPAQGGHIPAWALWFDRGFWGAHIPGDALEEDEGRRRRPGYFGLDRGACGGGGGPMERTGHYGMRLRDLGVSRINAVFVVADLRWGRPDAAKGIKSAKAAAGKA